MRVTQDLTVRGSDVSSPTVARWSSNTSFVSFPRAKGQSEGENLTAKSQYTILQFGALIDLKAEEGQRSTAGVLVCFFFLSLWPGVH